MIVFIAGAMVGAAIAVIIMACLSVASDADDVNGGDE
jgi:hypothetical protein